LSHDFPDVVVVGFVAGIVVVDTGLVVVDVALVVVVVVVGVVFVPQEASTSDSTIKHDKINQNNFLFISILPLTPLE
jgi:hypothetical protein